MDVLTAEQRSRNMAAIKSRDTRPEMAVRRLLHGLGFRYSLHRKDLPGRPDLAFPSRKKVVFVHGCYWHMHDCRYGRVAPATRAEFWRAKRQANVQRDRRSAESLEQQGWTVIVVWECEVRDVDKLRTRLVDLLTPTVSGPLEAS